MEADHIDPPMAYCVIAQRENGTRLSLGLFHNHRTAIANRERYKRGLERAGQPPVTYAVFRAEWTNAAIMERQP